MPVKWICYKLLTINQLKQATFLLLKLFGNPDAGQGPKLTKGQRELQAWRQHNATQVQGIKSKLMLLLVAEHNKRMTLQDRAIKPQQDQLISKTWGIIHQNLLRKGSKFSDKKGFNSALQGPREGKPLGLNVLRSKDPE